MKSEKLVGMPNPAAVYCIELGGKLLTEKVKGGSISYCLLPSGEKIEEWALFRRDNPAPKK